MSKQEVVLYESLETGLGRAIELYPHDRLFVLTDEHTQHLCLPSLKGSGLLRDAVEICVGAEDVHKTLGALASIWMALGAQGATRYSLLINLGGGTVTDLGGFAAATSKRGISHVNIPTTLFTIVDAPVEGKAGISFNGLRDEIGVSAPANSILIEIEFLRTLGTHNFSSGYTEVLKHGLVSSTTHWAELLSFDSSSIDYAALEQLISQSIQVKEDIVEQDLFEHGIRKALDLGHTVEHASESMALAENHPVLRGCAVVWGIVCELYLSHLKVDFPKGKVQQTIQFVEDNYGVFTFDCRKYDQLYAFITHDKKNASGTINFTLLKDIGDIYINQTAGKDTIFEMLDFYHGCMGI